MSRRSRSGTYALINAAALVGGGLCKGLRARRRLNSLVFKLMFDMHQMQKSREW
jgi:hypothetical protein